jgi:hypothetical protein
MRELKPICDKNLEDFLAIGDKNNNALLEKQEFEFTNKFEAICKKHNVPETLFVNFFIEHHCFSSIGEYFPEVSFMRKWIKAIARGLLTSFQLDYFLLIVDENEYTDPYWLITGSAFYYNDDRKYECIEDVDSVLSVLATRNSHRSKPLPAFEFAFWNNGREKVYPCPKVDKKEFLKLKK